MGVVRASALPARLTPYVEREAERASLRRLLDDTLVGHGKLALVAGEPGVGKSRLVAEIGEVAQARGMRVLAGHCVEMSGAAPYLPYVEIIEQAISGPRSSLELWKALGDVAAEIARIAPALRRVFPDIPPPVELPAELARRYVWNSFGSSSAAPRRASRCCWCSRTCIGPMSRLCCSPSTWRRCCLRCRCWCSAPTGTSKWISSIRWPGSSASWRAGAWWNG